MSNQPPYAILALTEVEFRYLTQLVEHGRAAGRRAMLEAAEMPSSDPLANSRSVLITAAALDIEITNSLGDKLKASKGAMR